MKAGVVLHRIWVLEDEPSAVRLMKEALSELGLAPEISVAETLADGKAQISKIEKLPQEQWPELFILDINVPGGSGTDMLTTIRQGPLKHMPCIMLTTSNAVGDIVAAETGGADAYFVKAQTFVGMIELMDEIKRFWEGW